MNKVDNLVEEFGLKSFLDSLEMGYNNYHWREGSNNFGWSKAANCPY